MLDFCNKSLFNSSKNYLFIYLKSMYLFSIFPSLIQISCDWNKILLNSKYTDKDCKISLFIDYRSKYLFTLS